MPDDVDQDGQAAALPGWQASRRKRLEIRAIAALATPLLRMLASTWRWRVEGEDRRLAAEAGGAHGIHAFWHGRIVHGVAHFRDRGIVVITSENFDGEWIARIIRRFGFGTARGSSSRGARKALLQLVRESRAHPTAFTVDGPRGPARVAQPGAVWFSKATGNPVVPFHAEAAAYWSLSSWDRTQIPGPSRPSPSSSPSRSWCLATPTTRGWRRGVSAWSTTWPPPSAAAANCSPLMRRWAADTQRRPPMRGGPTPITRAPSPGHEMPLTILLPSLRPPSATPGHPERHERAEAMWAVVEARARAGRRRA